MDRREFLKVAGTAALTIAAGGLTGCAATAPPPTLRRPAPSGSPSEAIKPPATDSDWAELGRQLTGAVVRPGDPSYATDHQLFHPQFDSITPAGIVFCASPSDVQRTIAFAQTHDLPLAPRSGGHSYAGYSTTTGIVCDVTRMANIMQRIDGTAVIGAGARLIDVYARLAASGVVVPAGSCPGVGIAGLALGGGVGIFGRVFGLTSDNVLAMQLVTAAGDLLTCNANQNSDLYWACRGGGGGNFGILTSLTMKTHAAPSITLFSYRWPWAAAADVLAGWQQWIRTIPNELWSNCHLLSSVAAGSPTLTVGGAYVGSQLALEPWLKSLSAAVGTRPSGQVVGTYGLLDAIMIEAGCSGRTAAQCRVAQPGGGGVLEREASIGRSDVVMQPLTASAITTLIDGVNRRQGNPQATTVAGVALDAMGGAINRVSADATAFVHRSALCIAQYNATWPTDAPAAVMQSNVDDLNRLYAAMRPHASGFAYQNYIDATLPDWQRAYYGTNLQRLITVKAHHDPSNFFRFAQSIPVA